MMEEEQKQEEPRFKAGDIIKDGVTFDPARHRILKNGTVFDTITKKFVTAPAKEHAPITASNAQAVARKRWDASREAFARGVARGMTGREDVPLDAWAQVGEKAAELLHDAKSARGFADLARFAGEAAGFVPMARGREEMQEQNEGVQQLTVVLVAQLIQQFGKVDDYPQAIDGNVSDENVNQNIRK